MSSCSGFLLINFIRTKASSPHVGTGFCECSHYAWFLWRSAGVLGLKLSQMLGYANIWDLKVSNKQKFLIPAIVGIAIGIFFIITDTILARFHTLGPLPHPPFPISLVASITSGIGEEIIFRLFFISFWVWLISCVILRNR